MGRTFIRQDVQIRNSVTYDDTLASTSTLESGAVHIEDDLNGLRSQTQNILGETNWYDPPARTISLLDTDLTDLEGKKFLCRANILTDVTVPAGAAASGTIVAVAKALLIDTETFTLDDGINAASVFEFDLPPDGVTGILVDVSADTTAIDVATRMVSSINGVGAGLLLTASNVGGTSATVTITHDRQGAVGNVTTWADTVVDAGFVVTQPTGGTGDVVVLSAGGSEAPSEVIAIALSQNGAVSAQAATSAAAFNTSHELTEIAGADAINPKNLLIIREASTGDAILSSGREVFGLLQVESTAVDGSAFNDASGGNRGRIVFVRKNSTLNDLEAAPGVDIAGLVVRYSYVFRINFDAFPEGCFLSSSGFVDSSASVDVTRQNAYDNQGITPVDLTTNATLDLEGAGVEWIVRDDLEATLFRIIEGSGGGTSEVEIAANVDIFDVDAAVNDFLQGVSVDSGGTQIDVGVVAGQIGTTGAADLTVDAGGELLLNDTNFDSEATWAQAGVKVTETTAEITAYEANFGGEVSLFNAINQAFDNSSRRKVVAVVTGAIAPNADASGPANDNNLDANLGDLSAGTFVTDYDIFLNGILVRNGADASANHDVYPGTALANGQIKFEFALIAAPGNPDVITVIDHAA